MAKHNEMGQQGEAIARRYLSQQGYEILETNYRVGRLEADFVAYHEGKIVFVEVKTRASHDYGDPESFVDRKKQRAYIALANSYVQYHHRDEEVRFDIVSVIINKEQFEIKHIPNAFTTVG